MDLLGGYGSDGDGSGSDSERSAPPAPSSVRKHAPATVSVLGSMPPPKVSLCWSHGSPNGVLGAASLRPGMTMAGCMIRVS